MKYVIIGNGVAGISGAEAIREMDPDGDLTLIADEAFPPYCRPMISMVLAGAVPPEKLPIRGPDFYDRLKINARIGQRATGIDTVKRLILMPDENHVPFDRLLIASGADPRPVKADGLELENIFYMRTEAHVQGMLKALPGAKNALVLGGGLVGFKAAYGLMHRGINVTLLIRSGYPLSMQADEIAGQMILDELVRHGLKVQVGVSVTAFEGHKKIEQARLSDGSVMPCELAVIGKGVLPALSFVPRERIPVDLGILVNARMETGCSGIFAAGDVAEYIDIARKIRWVNAIWPEAVDQGRIAGMNMAGRPVAYIGSLGRNVIRIFGLDIMTGGIVSAPDEKHQVFSRLDSGKRVYRKLVFRDDILVGMAMVNNIEQGGILLSLIRSRTPVRVPKEKLLDPLFNYKTLLPPVC